VGFVPFLGRMLLIFSLKKIEKKERKFWAAWFFQNTNQKH
jgi:hypothetical protein